MKFNMCLSLISHASIYMPLELNLLGSSDLLFIDSYDTLNQSHACSNSRSWRYLFWKQKLWQLLMLKHHQCHIYKWEYFLWFHIAILYILSSFKLIASWVCYVHFLLWPYTYTTLITVRHGQSYRCKSSPWNKKKTSKVSHHTHESLFKKKRDKKKRERW